ncbi:MAG: phosphoglucosamine mutase [Ruminococcus flavefaciens]|nr:phosphoglucosamine mutase [Ruminococcus flavefaciens]MCM1229420.1 phosphoglucosamine mutase [Ruminococcus flavefaciens]
MGKIFGKNGMKGIAVTEFTCEFAMQVGRALAFILSAKDRKSKFLIAKDTRSSSDALESALCAGICSCGADVELLGEIPAAALAWNIREKGADSGIMITASHVNTDFNGLKLFASNGYRLGDEAEDEIERLITESPQDIAPVQRKEYGRVIRCENAVESYIERLEEIAKADLSGLKIAVDCGNGCTSTIAEGLFKNLGAEVVAMGNKPDRTNINTSGSIHIESLMDFVVENKCVCGLAFDGSGERCLAVDENGSLVDGDIIIALCARSMKKRDKLNNNAILATQANNLSLIQFAKANNIEVVSAPVGERSMIQKMLECDCSIGGDPSGHIIFPDDMPNADGMLTGIRLLEILRKSGETMSSLSAIIEKFPQVMLNVPIGRKFCEIWKNDKVITSLIEEFEGILGDDGRIIVRETGREPVIRIRIEGRDFSAINDMAMKIAETIKERTQA